MLIAKAKDLYQNWLEEQPEEIPVKDQLKFSDLWVRDWMKQYHVSLKKPNKRYVCIVDRKYYNTLKISYRIIRGKYFYLFGDNHHGTDLKFDWIFGKILQKNHKFRKITK